MEKLPGVESATVKLNEGRAVLVLKPENSLTLGQIRDSVRRNGFTPRDARITATAEVVASEALRLRVTGTQEIYDVRGTSALEQQLRAAGSRPVLVDGTISVGHDPKDPMVWQVTSVKPVAR
jgi:hypothetical protein